MKTYFNLELKNNDERVLRTSTPFYTSAEFVCVAHDLASVLKDATKGEYEIALFVNEDYDSSVFFEKRKDYFGIFCMIISEVYYTLDFRFYVG